MTISAVDFQEDFKSELNRPLWKMSLQGVAKQSRLHLLHLWFHVVVLTGYSITRFPLSSRLLRPQDSHMTPDTNLEHNTALGSADCLAVFPVHKKSESLDNHFAIVLCMATSSMNTRWGSRSAICKLAEQDLRQVKHDSWKSIYTDTIGYIRYL